LPQTNTSLARNLQIISQLVRGEFKLRYKSSLLGYFWTLFKPLMLFGVIYLVFSVFLRSPMQNYAVYLLLGIVLWTFFTEATMTGMNSLTGKRELITKIYFPRQTLVYAATLSSLITLLLNLLIFAVFYFGAGLLPGWASLLFLPYLLLLLLFTTGISLILASLYARFHDLSHIWEVILQILFWITPIVYDLSFVPEQFRAWLYLNPMTQFISFSRRIFLIDQVPSLKQHAVLLAVSLGVFAIGYWFFKKTEYKVAEMI
jgi:ABC-type polysaccharide/polyol phosphate export permease